MILLRLKITNDVNSMVNNKLCADVGRQRKSRSTSWIIMSILKRFNDFGIVWDAMQ